MRAEYGLSQSGDFIQVGDIYFLDAMAYLCGQTFTVKDHKVENPHTNTMRYYSEEGLEKRGYGLNSWIITAGMLELACCADEEDTDLVAPDLIDLFSP